MTTTDLNIKIKNLRELRRVAEELAAEIETTQDEIKAEIIAQNTDILTGDDFKITWKKVKSSRFDSAAFKKTHEELFKQYQKETISRRFCLV